VTGTVELWFEGRNAKEIIRKTLFGKLEPLRERDPSIPQPLDRRIRPLMRDRADRPADAEMVVETLDRYASRHNLRWKVPLELMRQRTRRDSGDQGRFVPTVRVAATEETGVSTGF
jgi:hypothetical protein